ncbi:DUF4352 domain-containing protein [Salibacterium lacus]|uniref:DUF4352 domain-containing protein n=1 Tax=Salibacterium lacus TaxID=1898109 RepID=A0ABW5SZJ1_9BACI
MKKVGIGCLASIGGLVVLIIIISIFASGDDTSQTSGGDSGSNGSEETSADTETSNGEESSDNSSGSDEEVEEEAPTYSIGDTVEVGAVEYTVNNRSTAEQVGPSSLPEEASDMYLVLDITFKNNGNEAVTVNSGYLKLKQGETTFEADEMASMSANQNEDGTMGDTFFLEEVNPGSERNGKVVFDVAPDIAEADDLQVEVQEGIFGSVTEVINLSE